MDVARNCPLGAAGRLSSVTGVRHPPTMAFRSSHVICSLGLQCHFCLYAVFHRSRVCYVCLVVLCSGPRACLWRPGLPCFESVAAGDHDGWNPVMMQVDTQDWVCLNTTTRFDAVRVKHVCLFPHTTTGQPASIFYINGTTKQMANVDTKKKRSPRMPPQCYLVICRKIRLDRSPVSVVHCVHAE